MQVTTGNNSVKKNLLFKISGLAALGIVCASFALIYFYRAVELEDMRSKDVEAHKLLGGNWSSMEAEGLLSSKEPKEISFAISQSLFGYPNSSAKIICDGAGILAWGGASPTERPFDHRPNAKPGPEGEFIERFGQSIHASSWPLKIAGRSGCSLEITTSLEDESNRIQSRSIKIFSSMLAVELALSVILLWLARRGDERLLESEKDQIAMENELYYLAHYDSITHLPNRSLFWDRLDASIVRARRLGKSVGLLVLDINGFNKINQELGRTVGDKILAEAAMRVQSAARASDLICRIGPDEFAVLLEDLEPQKSKEALERLAASLIKKISDPWSITPAVKSVSISYGGAMHPQDGETSELLLAKASEECKNHRQSRTVQ